MSKEAGKGDTPRPMDVSRSKFYDNFDQTFNKEITGGFFAEKIDKETYDFLQRALDHNEK